MAKPTALAQEQDRAMGRLNVLAPIEQMLAGGGG
jgi:hypothetical protein